MPITRGLRRNVLIAATALTLVACGPVMRNHGYVPREEELANIIVGVDTRDTVADLVGPPSSAGLLNDSGYYYVASTFRHFGAFAPKEIEREVLAITFDSNGVVENIARYGLEDGQVIVLSRRVTDTGVEDRTFIRQLLGSIGRVDAGQFLSPG